MSQHDGTNISSISASDDTLIDAHTRRMRRRTDLAPVERDARRDDKRRRLIRRDAVYGNELRAALDEARSLRQFKRLLAGA